MKFKYILGFVVLITTFQACDNFLDKQPLDVLAESNFWSTPDNVQSALIGCYDALQHPAKQGVAIFDNWGARDVFTPIAMSRSGDYNAIAEGTADPTNYIFEKTWGLFYKGVVRCNDLLCNIDKVDFGDDQSTKDQIMAEAYFLRALFYYGLVDVYGDVPLILKIQTIAESQVARTAKADVVDQMLTDLSFAIDKLPNSYGDNGIGRATVGAALSLDVKFRLLKKDWNGAAASAQKVLNLGYKLETDFPQIFSLDNENNKEVIFDIQFIGGAMGEGNIFDKLNNNGSAQTNGWSRINPSTYLVDIYERIEDKPTYTHEKKIAKEVYEYFEGRDPRMDWTIIRPGSYLFDKKGKNVYWPYKVPGYTKTMTGMTIRKNTLDGVQGKAWDSPNNWILFRLADIMLNYAEAETQSSFKDGEIVDTPQIYKVINDIRLRASDKLTTYDVGSLSKEQMLECIYKERIRELAFEGWLYTDYRRWGWLKINDGFELYGVKTTTKETTLGKDAIQVRKYKPYMDLWAIPQSERELNKNLSQNKGYSE